MREWETRATLKSAAKGPNKRDSYYFAAVSAELRSIRAEVVDVIGGVKKVRELVFLVFTFGCFYDSQLTSISLRNICFFHHLMHKKEMIVMSRLATGRARLK